MILKHYTDTVLKNVKRVTKKMSLEKIINHIKEGIVIMGIAVSLYDCSILPPDYTKPPQVSSERLMYMQVSTNGEQIFIQEGYDIYNDKREDVRLYYKAIPNEQGLLEMKLYGWAYDINNNGIFEDNEYFKAKPEENTIPKPSNMKQIPELQNTIGVGLSQ